MSDPTKDQLVRLAKITAGVVSIIALLTVFSGAFIKLAGIQTTETAEKQHVEIVRESREIDRAILRELRHLTGVMECNYRGVAWERCPTVRERTTNGYVEIF